MPNPTVQAAQYQVVALSGINLNDKTYHITSRTDINDLLESIRYDGLLTPPLLIRVHSVFVVVSGFRRIAACQKLKFSDITARILKPETAAFDCLRMAIAENALQRSLNLIETSRSLQKLSAFIPGSKELVGLASILGLAVEEPIIDKIKRLCLLPKPIQDSILGGTISLTVAMELESLEADCAIIFNRIFDQLRVGINKQKDIVNLSREISSREGISLKEVLEDDHIIDIMTHRDLDRGQKSRRLRAYLRRRRYPRIVEAEKKFETYRKNLKLGNDIRLIPPKNFESTRYGFNLTFTSIEELKSIHRRIYELMQHHDFKKILGHSDYHSTQIKKS
ncbi:MAG: ParB N-terminal domain-containing protein [Desulfobacterales bacterium]